MNDSIVTYELRGQVACITMNDGKANALSNTMLSQLASAFDRAESEAGSVLLSGRDGRFCAGFDLKVMMSGPEHALELVMTGGQLLLRLYELGLPLVIACTGHALAGGVLLAATGDTRIGAHGDFKIGLNEVANGMPVPVLAHELARDRLDPRELFAAVTQARIYDPEGAVRAGWLDRVVAPEALAGVAMEEAARLAKLPAGAYSVTKRSLREQTLTYIRDNMKRNLDKLRGQ